MHSHVFTPSAEQFRTLSVAAIAFPDTLISALFQRVDERLLAQVAKFGIFQPLPVEQVSEHSFQLLGGYQYLPVLRQLRYKEIVCQVTTDLSGFSRCTLQICHGLSTVLTSPILQANLLQTAAQALTEDELVQLLPLMGHKPQRYKIQELLTLLELTPASIQALHHGYLAPKTGKLLSRLASDDQNFLVDLIAKYRPGGSKQQKLVEMLLELALRHNLSISELLKPWMKVGQEYANLPQQLQGLLRYLQEQSFPNLTDAEKEFQRLPQELNLPAHVQLHHSASFEDESVEL
ncbi:MAG: hypothetical protein PHI97_21730, partial [Desulfobulbus sp.]|nr:hypothetical protein [Desulfobulbus sp.]